MQSNPETVLRIGVIGAGAHSRIHHLPALARYRDDFPETIRLVALCDRDSARAESQAAKFGFEQAFTDIEPFLSEAQADAIVAITPVPITAAIARRLIEYGRPFLMEKPPAEKLEDGLALLELQQRTGVPVMVSMNRRYDPAFRAIQELIDGRAIHRAEASFLRVKRTDPDFLFSTAIHLLDTLHAACGSIREQHFQGNDPSDPRKGRLDIQFENGAVGEVTINPYSGHHEESYRFEGSDFTASFQAGGQRFAESGSWMFEEKGSKHPSRSFHPEAPPPVYVADGAWNETIAFIAMARREQGPYPGLEEAVASLKSALDLSKMADPDFVS